MIPIYIAGIIVITDILLAGLSVIYKDDKFHTDLVMGVAAGIMAAILGAAFSAGIVYDVIGGVVHPIDTPVIGTIFYAGSVIMFALTTIRMYNTLNQYIVDTKERQHYNKERFDDDEQYNPDAGSVLSGKVKQVVTIVAVCVVILFMGILTSSAFLAITTESAGATESAQVQAFMEVHAWIYLLTAMLMLTAIIVGFKTMRSVAES